MGNDPSVLFYTGDFLAGTFDMEDVEVGQYIRLLCLQQQKGGYLTKETMNKLCGMNPKVVAKFQTTEDGLYYNTRMMVEMEKRAKFTQSRLDNLKGTSPHKDPHKDLLMENRNRNRNENKKKASNVRTGAPVRPRVRMRAQGAPPRVRGVEVDPKFKEVFEEWLEYKDARREKYKTEKSLKLAYEKLVRLSRGDPDTAQAMIVQAMENNWAGFFELKESRTTNKTSGSRYKQSKPIKKYRKSDIED